MQSHASRHVVSESLSDRHPYRDPPFEKEPRPDEVAEAYGDRQIPKLVGVLQLSEEQLPESERIHCLKLFYNVLSTQETKVKAIQADAIQPLLHWLSHEPSSTAVKQLCCKSLGSICQLQQGRAALAVAGGVAVLTQALTTCPDAAVEAVRVLATCSDGLAALHASPAHVTSALVELMAHPGSTWTAVIDATACLAGMCKCDEGVIEALACQAPRCLQHLATRVLRFVSNVADNNNNSSSSNSSSAQLFEALRAAGAAMVMIASHADGKAQLRLAECIPVLTHMLAVGDDDVQGAAAACLASVTIEVDSKVPIMSLAAPALIELVREGKKGIAPSAKTALLCAAEHLDARRKLELLLQPAELKELLGLLPQVPPDYKYVVWTAESLTTQFHTA